MSPFINALGALVGGSVLAGCIAGATEAEFGKAVAAECAIVSKTGATGQEIHGRFLGAGPVDGSYDLTVIATDAAGNMTTIRQGGAFVAAAGEPVPLGSVRVGAEQQVAASMVVTLGQGGVLACDG